MSLEEVECFLIQKALARFDGNVREVAKALGLSGSALYRRRPKSQKVGHIAPLDCDALGGTGHASTLSTQRSANRHL